MPIPPRIKYREYPLTLTSGYYKWKNRHKRR